MSARRTAVMTSRNRAIVMVAAVLFGGAAAAIPSVMPLLKGLAHTPKALEGLAYQDGVGLQGRQAAGTAPGIGMPGAPPTSAGGLRDRIAEMESRVAQHPDDSQSALLLADALLRQARATTDGRPASRAATVLD